MVLILNSYIFGVEFSTATLCFNYSVPNGLYWNITCRMAIVKMKKSFPLSEDVIEVLILEDHHKVGEIQGSSL